LNLMELYSKWSYLIQ